MAHLQALVERAGGAAAFNAITAAMLTQPVPAAGVEQANEFDDIAVWRALDEAILFARIDFLRAPSNDNSPIAAALQLRPYGIRREGGVDHWWRRPEGDARGSVDCALADVFDLNLEWIILFRRLYNHIHERPLGPNRLSAIGQAAFAAEQAAAEQAHFAQLHHGVSSSSQ
jgi:hypothetical protein